MTLTTARNGDLRARGTASALAGLLALAAGPGLGAGLPALAEPRGDTIEKPAAASDAKSAMPRLETDEPIRRGMAEIRRLAHHHHSLVTHRRLPPDMAVGFAAQVKNQAELIVATSKVPAATADVLASILVKIADGAEAVAGRRPEISQMDGIFLIDEALATYGARFDDETWTEGR
jgi:hypothetical protein